MTKGRRKPSFQAVEKAGGYFESLSPFLATKGDPRLCRGSWGVAFVYGLCYDAHM